MTQSTEWPTLAATGEGPIARHPAASSDQVAAVRGFNRFYTRRIGLLNEGLLNSAFSLTEARVLYELAQRSGRTAAEIGRALDLDAGYLSRLIKKFEERGLVVRTPSATDARQSMLVLTRAGRAAFKLLDRASQQEVKTVLGRLMPGEREALLRAMGTVQRLLAAPSEEVAYRLRSHRPGDIGWVVHRQAVLYAEEYGWNGTFEALAADIAAAFLKHFDPARERCWIAERQGEIVGSVFLVRQSDETAKLRMLYVEPSARGLGIGRRLVDECIRFARANAYETLTLWTNDVLASARRIYEAAGFRLVKEEPHRSFGKDLIGQTWDLKLR